METTRTEDEDIECIDFNESVSVDYKSSPISDLTMNGSQLKGAGCKITSDDLPVIMSTIACFICFIVYGAFYTSLGAAIPLMCKSFNKNESDFGFVFTMRGIGVMLGSIVTPFLSEYAIHWHASLSKGMLACIGVAGFTGLASIIIISTDIYYLVLILFLIQVF